VVLEQCKESALARLEELHNQRELAIMETLEDIDLAQVPSWAGCWRFVEVIEVIEMG
jgi:hypothetical protein